MSIDPAKAKREAEMRDKLPDDVVALVDAAKLDPGAPFEPTAVALLSELRASDPAAWTRARAMLKAIDGVPIGDLDRMTARAGGEGEGKQGRPVEWPDSKPCPDPVDGGPMLDDAAGFFRRYVWIDEPGADALALWVVMTWIHDRLDISPFANLTSATKRCGKSLLLEVLAELVYRPLPLSGQVTAAALFRIVEPHAPTLMLDEADTYMRDDEILRGVVNGSQRRNVAYIVRCVEPDNEPRRFGTWCPKLIAGIGNIPDTIRDRSLVVRLERKPVAVRLDPWRERDREAVEAMRGQIARWTADNAGRIGGTLSAVTFPDSFQSDRARDAWAPLLAIANAAGGEWAGRNGRAWKACEHFAATSGDDEGGAREMLLADLYSIFEAGGWPEAIPSATIVERLAAMESQPWPEWKRGKPITVRQLASLLRPFDVHPRNHRAAGGQSKAYFLGRAPSRVRCLSPQRRGIRSVPPSQCLETRHFRKFASVPPRNRGTVQGLRKPLQSRGWDGGTDRNPVSGGNGTESARLPKRPRGTESAAAAYQRARDGE